MILWACFGLLIDATRHEKLGGEMRSASIRAALAAVARAAAVERPPRRWGALLSTVRGGCASSPALGGSAASWLRGDALPRPGNRDGGMASGTEAAAVARGGDAQPRGSSAQHPRGVAPVASLGSMAVFLYAQRCLLGISAPRYSRASLASFSSRVGRSVDHSKLNQRISASTTLREVLSEVRESHSDFKPRDAATACHRLAKYVGKYGQTIQSDQDAATFQLAIQAAKRTASGMDSQEVSNTMWAFGTLAEKGMHVDAAAVRAVSAQAPRVVGQMDPQDISNTLWVIAKLAEKGVKVDAAAVRALSAQAPRVSGQMKLEAVSNMLWGLAMLAEKGVEVDAAAVQAVSKQAPRVAGEMEPLHASNMRWATVFLIALYDTIS